MTTDGFSCFLGFQNFSGEDPRTPLLDLIVCDLFFAETTGPIELKFHMATPKDWGTKVCSNGPGHMTKLAPMPIYGKNPLKIFCFRTRRPMTLGLGMKH